MVILILGAPGAGKTSLAKLVAERINLPIVDTGDLLRSLAERDPALERELNTGDLADPEEVNLVIFSRLSREKGSFIVDGFPRTVYQAQSLITFLKSRKLEIDFLFELVVPVEILIARLLARGRADDKMEVIEHRIALYNNETIPVFEYFRNHGTKIIRIDNTCPLEDTKKEVLGILKPDPD
jgi:adenylate kinase